MNKSRRLVFLGNERLATGVSTQAPLLRALINAGYEISAVVASHQDAVSRTKKDLEIGQLAHDHGIPVILPGPKFDLIEKLKNHPADAAILAAFGVIVPQKVIDFFPQGIINIHPSLLPKYRGATPIESVILDGASQTGVSLMQLSAKMDAGPVYARSKLVLKGSETKQELADKLGAMGAGLLIQNLSAILDGTLKPHNQDESAATYTKLISKKDGQLDFNKPAQILERQVRAYAGWPKSQAKLKDFDVIITKVRVANSGEDGELVQKCSNGWIEILELIAPSGRTMSGADFIRGYLKN